MSEKQRRILYVSSCWPHGPVYGGQLRALHIGRALQHFGRPTMVMVGADAVDQAAVEATAAEFELAREIPVEAAPVRSWRQRGRVFCDPEFTNIHGLAATPAGEAWLREAQERFDLIWFFKLRTANLLRQARWPGAVVDIDDFPSNMERARWQSGESAGIRWKAGLRMLLLRRHERHLRRRFGVLAVCSEADRARLPDPASVHVIPNGYARPAAIPVHRPVNPPRIGFIGLYQYQPNLEGVRWFMERCWPGIQQEIPGVRLRLVGAGTDGPDKPIHPAVDGLGWVENTAAEIATWSAMIVPIFMGGGTRVKIADAFSRKCPLVATRLGAFGYDVQSGRELLIADDPDEFAGACIALIRDPEKAAAMAERAFAAFLEKWTWEAIAPRVWAAAEAALRQGAEKKFKDLGFRI